MLEMLQYIVDISEMSAFNSLMKEKSAKITDISILYRYIDDSIEGNHCVGQTSASLGFFFAFYRYIGNFR